MAKATVTSLTEKERALVAETQPARLRQLDEDELVDLHTRVRRARTKFVTLHRRAARGSAAAGPDPARAVGGDGAAAAKPRRTPRQPIERKTAAATRSTGARRQAKRDAR